MRKKKLKSVNLIVLLIITIILVINMGYSLYYDSLNIGGSATTIIPSGDNILNIQIIPDIIGDKSTVIFSYRRQVFDETEPGGPPPAITSKSETLNSNTLTIIYNADVDGTKNKETVDWKIKFKNTYNFTLFNGMASSQILYGASAVTASYFQTPVTLTSNSIGEMTGYLYFNQTRKVQMLTTVQYLVNGVIKYFYYNITVNVS